MTDPQKTESADLMRFLRRCRKRGFRTVGSSESTPVSDREARRIRDLIFPPAEGSDR